MNGHCCVCGHWHPEFDCVHCTCTLNHPDDGLEHGGPTTVARNETYDGFYAKGGYRL